MADSVWAQLPDRFIEKRMEMFGADLLLILGTSLTVHPFASLAWTVPPGCPRVLFNLEEAGDLGRRPDDVLALEECDSGVRKLAHLLGWEAELDAEWATTVLPGDDEDSEAKWDKQARKGEEAAKDHVEELAADIAASLNISGSRKLETTADTNAVDDSTPPKTETAPSAGMIQHKQDVNDSKF
jgi:NAD+-dependent protein deacetylase SIR2